jgi:hypothetical protein
MRVAAAALIAGIALAALAGCGVETVEIERQPASAFGDDPAQRSAYDEAFDRCEKGKNLKQLANEANVKNAKPDAIARGFADFEPEPEIASATFSGCLDGLDEAKLT